MTTCMTCRGRLEDGTCRGCGRSEDGTRAKPVDIDACRAALANAKKRSWSGVCIVTGRLGFVEWRRRVDACECPVHSDRS